MNSVIFTSVPWEPSTRTPASSMRLLWGVPEAFGAMIAAGLGVGKTFAIGQHHAFAVPEGFRAWS